MTAGEQTRRRAGLTDGALAAALLAICVLTAPLLSTWMDRRGVDSIGYLLLVLACAPIAVRRRVPLGTLAITATSVAAYLVIGYPYGPVFLPLAVAIYTVGNHATTRRALLVAAGAFVALTVHVLLGSSPVGILGVLPAAAWITIPLTIGIARRLISESHARERAETEQRKLDDERLRLATEVHDIVGHGLAAIQMQADIALHLADTKPDQASTALKAISAASAAALSELRTTLSAITPRPDGSPDTSRAPTPGLARIEDLCGRMRQAGVEVDLSSTGVPRRVLADVDIAAYRIVQESLTNVVKHAAGRRATVRIGYEPSSVTLTVSSPHNDSAVVEGFGIRGMRRRAERLGGELAVEHGELLVVQAMIPTDDA